MAKLVWKPRETRKFGKDTLYYVSRYHYKDDARRRARIIRNMGYKARIVRGRGWQPWQVYASKEYIPGSRRK